MTTFTSDVFDVETIELAGTTESIVRGGRHLFGRLPAALAGVRRIGVLGWGPQGRAQALNLRDSLAGTGIGVTVGVFVAAMVAQIDVLAEHGHAWSEIVNESVIEAVDSLLPYMRARDVSYMVDNCSMTARLGARKWGPRFAAALDQLAFPAADGIEPLDPAPLAAFADHPVHGVLARLAPLRPPVDISV
ncbi:hypothetical protein [Actinocatenispora sera]|uniref:KARI N-terminal Rossmann domain-containing protein n=1 Tax=Actinocatenispora sera TaxID=390989 RepID=A0A810KZX5_9ACTN|nr:hypothetical protein [Actinocatenispora sera]BCJ27761.1 hypothetical protein Asera_18690 [Actinocatenispora sera]